MPVFLNTVAICTLMHAVAQSISHISSAAFSPILGDTVGVSSMQHMNRYTHTHTHAYMYTKGSITIADGLKAQLSRRYFMIHTNAFGSCIFSPSLANWLSFSV